MPSNADTWPARSKRDFIRFLCQNEDNIKKAGDFERMTYAAKLLPLIER